jgi:hypothetical protein
MFAPTQMPDRLSFEQDVAGAGRPALFKGLVSQWPAVQAAADSPRALGDYLLGHHTGRPLSTYVGAPDIGGRFFYRDDLRGFNFERGEAPLPAILKMLLTDEGAGRPPAIYSGAVGADDHFPRFAADNPLPLLPRDVMPRLWIGNETVVSTHYDVACNIACVAAGRRRFTLFPPEQVANLYVGPLENTISGQPVSMVDPRAPDLNRYPRFAEAMKAAIVVDLEPGDALFIPSLWWHHVEAFGRLNLLVNYWWSEPTDASAFETLIHGLLAIRDLPRHEREAWRAFFDHFVFDPGEGGAHLPDHAKGILGPRSPQRADLIRGFLMKGLSRPR